MIDLMTLSVTDDTVLNDGKLVNNKLQRMWKSLLSSLRYVPVICLEDQRKPWKTSVRIAGLRIEFRPSWTQRSGAFILLQCWIWLAPVTETIVQSNQFINDYVFSRLGGQFRSTHVSHPNTATFWWWCHGARSRVHRQDGHPTTATSICTQWLLHHRVHSSGVCCRHCSINNSNLQFVLHIHLTILQFTVTPL